MANVIPGIIANYPDGGMRVKSPAPQGDSVLVIGTAENGPVNQPVSIHSLSYLTDVFGSYMGEGSLVRGVYEVWGATANPVDVRAMRIGNGTEATVGIKEASGVLQSQFAGWPNSAGGSVASGIVDPTFSVSGSLDDFIDAVTITSKYPGNIYNRFTVSEGRDSDGRRSVVIYNPITDESIYFPFDVYNQYNTSVDVHNVSELVDAINAHSSLAPYVSASVEELSALYEVIISGTGTSDSQVVPASGSTNLDAYSVPEYVGLREDKAIDTEWNANGTPKSVTLRLSYVTTARDLDENGIPDAVRAPLPDAGVPSVIKVGPIGVTYNRNIPTAGNQINLSYVYDIALASGELLDVGGKESITLKHTPVNRNASQGMGSGYRTIMSLDGTDNTVSQYKEYNTGLYIGTATSGSKTTYTWTARLEPSFINDVYTGHEAHEAATNSDLNVFNSLPTTDLKVHVYETVNGVTSVCTKPFSISWASGTGTLTFTDSNLLPSRGTVISIDYSTVAGTLTECATMSELDTHRGASDAYKYYFVSGNTVTFAGAVPTDIKVSYEYKRIFEPGSDIIVSDDVLGEIKFVNPNKMPQLNRTGGARIGLNYTYLPEWVDLSTPLSLAGGTNGTNMTKKELYDALSSAYDAIQNYSVDIVLPMGVYLDDTKEDFDPETGVKREVNAGFHTQLAGYLESVNTDVGVTLGIIGVKPPVSRRLVDINNWVTKLTVPSTSDRNRAANFMPFLNCRWMSVVASDVIFNPKLLGLSSIYPEYYSNAATIYAGLIASLDPQMSTTYKYIGRCISAIGCKLSKKQLNDLTSMRYVTLQMDDQYGPIVTLDVTAAPVDSDYDKLTTVRIVKLVSDGVRAAAKPFIGTPNTHYRINALSTAINTMLKSLTQSDNNALQMFAFRIESSPEERRQGILRVELDIVPVFCIDQIHVTVNLKDVL